MLENKSGELARARGDLRLDSPGVQAVDQQIAIPVGWIAGDRIDFSMTMIAEGASEGRSHRICAGRIQLRQFSGVARYRPGHRQERRAGRIFPRHKPGNWRELGCAIPSARTCSLGSPWCRAAHDRAAVSAASARTQPTRIARARGYDLNVPAAERGRLDRYRGNPRGCALRRTARADHWPSGQGAVHSTDRHQLRRRRHAGTGRN